MMAVGLSASAADRYLSKLEEEFAENEGRDVDIACINSPSNITLAGDAKQIQFLGDLLQEQGVFARRLNIDMAYHSHHMKPISDEYRSCLQDLQPDGDRKSSTIMISSVTGAAIHQASDLTSPEYWVKNLTSTVRFSDAISTLSAQSRRQRKVLGRKAGRDNDFKISELVEVGPHHALRGPIRECLEAMNKAEIIKYYPMLVRRPTSSTSKPPASATGDILTLAGNLWELGHPIDLLAINDLSRDIQRALRVDLPEYPFNHSQVHWRESRVARNYRMRDTPHHDFLGVRSDDWNEKQAHWRNIVSETRLPWLRDHRLAGQYLYPGGGMVVMAVEAARQLVDAEKHPKGPSSFELRDLQILNAFQSIKSSDSQVETRFTLVPTIENPLWSQFHLFIYESNSWVEVCHGQIRVHHDTEEDEEGGHRDKVHTRWSHHLQNWSTQSFEGNFSKSQEAFDTNTFYDIVAAQNDAAYGPAFQTLDDIAVSSDGRVMADIHTRKWAKHYGDEHVSPHIIHPATVDGLFQMVFPVLLGTGDTILPTRIGRMWINAHGLTGLSRRGLSTLHAQVVCSRKGARGTTVRARVVSPDTKEPLLDLENYESTIVGTKDAQDTEPRKLCATMQWRPDVEAMSRNELVSVLAAASSRDSASIRAQTKSYMDQNLVLQYCLSDAIVRLESEASHHSDSYIQGIVQWVRHQSSRTYLIGDAQMERMRNDPSFRKQIFRQVATLGADGEFLIKLAENISDIILGKVDSRELLSDASLIQEFHKSILSESPCIPPMKEFLELLGHKNPAMRILELHGGTGIFTEVVTSALLHEGRPRWSSYDFTDASADTFPELQKRFRGISNSMEYRILNTNSDVVGQGFDEASYDLVVTCGVSGVPVPCLYSSSVISVTFY
jgi:acyl transferase domain-containing protein